MTGQFRPGSLTVCLVLFAASWATALPVATAAGEQALDAQHTQALTAWLATEADERPAIETLDLPGGLDKAQAAAARDAIWQAYHHSAEAKALQSQLGDLPPTMAELVADAKDGRVQIEARAMPAEEHTMPFTVIRRESKGVPEGGRALFICTHGGGANGQVDGPHAWPVNTREWQTQTQLAIQHYAPEGIYFVPRMADDRMGRWWHKHNQTAFENVIRHAVLHWGVDPNRVYKLGISEGGFGTAILAPFMADRFAGADAMAGGVGLGNPPSNLRNLAFRTDVGEKDTMFDRVGLAKKFHERLDQLHKQDPDGYTHSINVQPGRGHGIDYRPGVAWIAEHTRDAHPNKVVWISKTLHGRRREAFYWIGLTGEKLEGTLKLEGTIDRDANAVNVTAEQLLIEGAGGYETHASEGKVTESEPISGATLHIMLNDELVDLDKPVKITVNGKVVHEGKIKRSAKALVQTLLQRGDVTYAYPAVVDVVLE